MSDPNAPRPGEHDPAEQPVDGFSVTDEQHAAPSAPAAPGVGEPAQSFSSPAAGAGPEAPGQPAFSEPADPGQGWQHGQQQPAPGSGDAVDPNAQAASGYGQAPGAPQTPSAPQYGAPQGQSSAPTYGAGQDQHPYGQGQAGYGQGQAGYGQGQQPYGAPGGQPQYGAQYGAPGQPQYGAPGQPQYAAGAPMSPVDEKNAGMWGHLSGLSTIVTGGWGGWIGPLIVFLIYKDRSAFARQESKEALNFGIFMTILAIGLIVVGTILSIVGIGFILMALYWVPGLLQVIFSIIGAMRVNGGGSYRYPFNWRLVK
ncbi:DUF4870 domain-containing protein [Agrococcus carbonis]|uniref:Uncharacterized conserved protein, Tic20 family n=1 Tax=Agrococcus carbonis TaxID=684552 RepID=A0A1H1L357_9MICO|nr:DUF4870 domain-containing protein [Agrococcus carbonis]SDR68712.1 Uncharacterized conserved protein, Tic20 family [Agrococcus carbonis]